MDSVVRQGRGSRAWDLVTTWLWATPSFPLCLFVSGGTGLLSSALDVAAVTQHMALHRTFPCWCPAWDPPSLARHPCPRLTGF